MSQKVSPFICLSLAEASFTMRKINYDWRRFQCMDAAAVNSSNAIVSFISRRQASSALFCSAISFLQSYLPSQANCTSRTSALKPYTQLSLFLSSGIWRFLHFVTVLHISLLQILVYSQRKRTDTEIYMWINATGALFCMQYKIVMVNKNAWQCWH